MVATFKALDNVSGELLLFLGTLTRPLAPLIQGVSKTAVVRLVQ